MLKKLEELTSKIAALSGFEKEIVLNEFVSIAEAEALFDHPSEAEKKAIDEMYLRLAK